MLKNIRRSTISICSSVIFTIAASQLATAASVSTQPIPIEELRVIAEVYKQIKEEYVKPYDDKKLWDAATKGMVASLDPHSSYLDKKDFQELRNSTEGRFVGLGIEITREDGLIKIISPIEDTPAFRAGLRSGDLITRIDDRPVRGMSLERAVKYMRGKPNTSITLTIFRKVEERTFEVKINRANIKVQSVKAKWLNPDYLWLRVTNFQDATTADAASKLKKLLANHPQPKGLILDLRNNGGGLLQSAIGITGMFLPTNADVVSTKGQVASSNQVYKVRFKDYKVCDKEKFNDYKACEKDNNDPLQSLPALMKTLPMIVLVNAYSASGSEIVAGALQDHKRAKIMGKTTFGKGSVQTVKQISQDTAIKLTTSYYYTPNGRSIQNKGIQPDFSVDHFEEGDPYDVLITREADLQNHLANLQDPDEQMETAEREQQRFEKIRKYEERFDKMSTEQRLKERKRQPPDFGNLEKDFMLKQAINALGGKAVKLSISDENNFEDIKPKPSKAANSSLENTQKTINSKSNRIENHHHKNNDSLLEKTPSPVPYIPQVPNIPKGKSDNHQSIR